MVTSLAITAIAFGAVPSVGYIPALTYFVPSHIVPPVAREQ